MSELDKWANVHEDAVVIHSFFEFLSSKGINLCTVIEDYDRFLPIMQTHDDLIYEHFGIDFNKLEAERRELLEQIRKCNQT